MAPEKVKFGEQLVNKFIEVILARMIDAEHLQVRVKANLKQLSRGELESLAIEMFGFLLRRSLRVAEFRFDIGTSAVNLQSIRHKKIELLHPSAGSLRMVISQEQLTQGLSNQLVSSAAEEQVRCQLEAGEMAFQFDWISDGKVESSRCTTIPQIHSNGNAVVLDKGKMEGKEPPVAFVNAVIAAVSDILSLRDIANQGTIFNFQQLDMEAGNITVLAATHIENFPTA